MRAQSLDDTQNMAITGKRASKNFDLEHSVSGNGGKNQHFSAVTLIVGPKNSEHFLLVCEYRCVEWASIYPLKMCSV